MPVTLASRQLIVQKMDAQFNDDLKMRKDTTSVGKETDFNFPISRFPEIGQVSEIAQFPEIGRFPERRSYRNETEINSIFSFENIFENVLKTGGPNPNRPDVPPDTATYFLIFE